MSLIGIHLGQDALSILSKIKQYNIKKLENKKIRICMNGYGIMQEIMNMNEESI